MARLYPFRALRYDPARVNMEAVVTQPYDKITPAMQAQLSTLAAQMQANPTCKVVIIGQGNTSKVQQQRSWDRVNAIIDRS